ncbi:50S ribosomal protein L21 [Corynebacterium striatum]
MYAIVKTGGKQYKVAESDLVKVEKIEGEPGASVALTPVLLVDGATVKAKAADLEKVSVSAEIVEQGKGPKIDILKYKNKTGYKKRQGHRQPLTVLKITGIK